MIKKSTMGTSRTRSLNLPAAAVALLLMGSTLFAPASSLAQAVRIKAAYSAISAGLGSIWTAKETGAFAKEGLDVELLYIRTASPTMQALLSGELQFAHIGPVAVLNAWSEGGDVVWLGTTIRSMVFTLLALPSIKSPADLIGKRIGITGKGSSAEIAVQMALKHLNLDPAKVLFSYIGGVPDILMAMRSGAVQAGVVSPPTTTIGKKLGYKSLVFLPDLNQRFTFAGIVSSHRYVQENPRVARAFMKAITEGVAIYKKNPDIALLVLRKYAKGGDPELLREGYNEYVSALSSPPMPDLEGLENVRESLVGANPKLKTMDLRNLIDDRFMKEAIR